FITQQPQRQDFFQQIRSRLKAGGYLLNIDLAAPIAADAFPQLLKLWRSTLAYTGMPESELEKFMASYTQDISVLPVPELASLIETSGFTAPEIFFQAALMHGWICQRADKT
ncbi:MAG: SAM-dependent methyltransferase, partial [Pseudomonadales bacterium]|nr:SAM-dependent methyltransferase [Pseudomonadales bacterium]